MKPDLDGSDMIAEVVGKVAWVQRVWVCLDWDKCRVQVVHDMRSHVVAAGDTDAARDSKAFEASGRVKQLSRAAAAKKEVDCYEGLLLTGP